MAKAKIKAEYLRGECDTLQAIEALTELGGMTPREAESCVHEWKSYETGNKRYPREEDDENNEEGA